MTDTGVGFEAGNICITIPQSLYACIPSSIVLFASLTARAVHEYQATGAQSSTVTKAIGFLKSCPLTNNVLTNNPVTRSLGYLFNAMVKNPGVGVEVSAFGLGLASLYIPLEAHWNNDIGALQNLYQWGQAETILAAFSVANAMNGGSSRLKNQFLQNSLRMTATAIAATGVMMTTGSPLSFIDWHALETLNFGNFFTDRAFLNPNDYGQLLLVGATTQSMWQTLRHLPAQGLMQPQLLFAAACGANAVANYINHDPYGATANAIWAVAFISLDAVFKRGGFYQKYIQSRQPLSPA